VTLRDFSFSHIAAPAFVGSQSMSFDLATSPPRAFSGLMQFVLFSRISCKLQANKEIVNFRRIIKQCHCYPLTNVNRRMLFRAMQDVVHSFRCRSSNPHTFSHSFVSIVLSLQSTPKSIFRTLPPHYYEKRMKMKID
jgi:hypothetical protein